jgi:hypothetical protein
MSTNYEIARLPSSIDSQQQEPMQPKITFSIWHTFKHHIPHFIITIIVDVILPLVIYFYSQKHVRPVYALLAASSPPLLMMIFKAIWLCTFDALGFLVFFSFAITAIVAIISRSPIILLLEKSLITGILSLLFGVTLIPFKCCQNRCRWRPLAYYFYQDLVPTKRKDLGLPDNVFTDEIELNNGNYARLREEIVVDKLNPKQEVAQVYEWLYKNCSSFRQSCYLITSIWSIGYLLEFLARISLILARLSINKIVIYGHIILSTITVIMIVSTILCIAVERKFTLAFVERWTTQHLNTQQRRSSVVIVNCDSNCVLSVNT